MHFASSYLQGTSSGSPSRSSTCGIHVLFPEGAALKNQTHLKWPSGVSCLYCECGYGKEMHLQVSGCLACFLTKSLHQPSLAQKLSLKLIHFITFLGNLRFASGKDFCFLSSLKKARSAWDICFICTTDHVLFYKFVSRWRLSFNSLESIWTKGTERNKDNIRSLIVFTFIFHCSFTLPLLS